MGNGSQQEPVLAFVGDLGESTQFSMTGPSVEVKLGFFARDGIVINYSAVACLAEAPRAIAAYVTVDNGSQPGYVKISLWTSAFAAAAGNTTAKVTLIAVRGSSVGR